MSIFRIFFIVFFGIYLSVLRPLFCSATNSNVIPHSNSLRSASELDYPPFALVKNDGSADGFSVELLKAVAHTVGVDISFHVGPWNQIKQKLIDGKIDVLPFVSYSEARDKVLDFTAPYLRLHGTIFIRKGETSIRSESDLKDKEILVMRGDTAHEYAVKTKLSDKLILTDSFEDAMELLSSGKHDAVIIQQLAGIQLLKRLNISNIVDVSTFQKEDLKPVAIPLKGFEQKFCIAVQEGNKELLSRLNEGLAIVIANGVYDELYSKWFDPILPQPPVNITVIIKYILIILLPVLVFLGMIGIWYLKKEVARKTKELKDQVQISENTKSLLKENEAHLKTLINTLPDLVWFKDLNGIYQSCNTRFEDFFGADGTEIIGKTDYDFLDKTLADFFRQKDNEAILKGASITNEETITFAKDGHTEILETIKTPLFDTEGNIRGVLGIGRNITQRKEAEDLLRHERDQFNRIIENIPAGIGRLDTEGKIIYLNRCAEEILGIKMSATVDRTYNDSSWKITDFTGNPYPEYQLAFNIVKLTGKPVFDVQHAIEWPDGTRIFLSINAMPLLKEAGIFDGVIVSVNDITKKYQAEQKYKMLFEEMIDGFALHEIICNEKGDPVDYRFLDVNPAFERLTTLKSQSVLGKTVLEVLPDTEPYWIEKYGQVALTGKPAFFQNYSKELNRYFQVTAFSPAIKQFACIFVDVSERKKAEKEIWESKERFQKVFNSQSDAILVLNNDDNRQIIEMNQATTKIFGYDNDELIGKAMKILHENDAQQEKFKKEFLLTIKKEGRLQNFDFKMKRKDGSVFPSENSVFPLNNDSGEITGWVSIVRDVTERKQLESRLLQSQKLESIGTLAGGIAHDFNNILFPIVGMSEMLMEDLPQDSPEYESAQEIAVAGKRGSELVKQILAFSRQTENKMIPVRVQQIMKEVLKLIRAAIPSNIEINYSLGTDCGLVMADPTQIHQVAMNLITNAYHAVENTNGRINVELKTINLANDDILNNSLQQGRYVVLTVSDTGYGIDPQIINKIFEPYFTTKIQGRGTGLGLSVVYGIIKEHKGTIDVSSEIGKGTTFNVYLPNMDKSTQMISSDALTLMETGSERILLVDDEIPIARLEKLMLERLGYDVTELTSSVDALEVFKANPNSFDIVISDMSMPNVTGLQLAQEIFTIRHDIPIIICTGFSENINETIIAQTGIKGLLMKPVIRADMAKMIRNILDEA